MGWVANGCSPRLGWQTRQSLERKKILMRKDVKTVFPASGRPDETVAVEEMFGTVVCLLAHGLVPGIQLVHSL